MLTVMVFWPVGMVRLNLPSMSVTVPVDAVPAFTTAPINGSLCVPSMTVPMILCCAKSCMLANKAIVINSKCFFMS